MGFYLPMTRALPLLAAALALAAGGCSATTAGTAQPTAPMPPATPESLGALLLPAGDAGEVLGSAEVVVTREVTAPWDDSAHFTGADAGCLPIAGAAQRAVYDGSGWTALRGQVLREAPTAPAWSHFAVQAVVLFPTTAAATEFRARSQPQWEACADREVSYAQQLAPEQVWSVGPVTVDGEVLTLSRTQRGPQRWFCQRALAAHGTVVIDVEACSADAPTAAAAGLVRAIGARLPTP